MKMTVFENVEKEKVLVFKAVLRSNGEVSLCIVNEEGRPEPGGIICTVQKDGTMRLANGIHHHFGLSRRDDGTIRVSNPH